VEPLYGSFEHSLDSKGRVIVPASLRSRFERNKDAAVVSCYLEKCLAVWPPEEFAHRLSMAMAAQDRGQEERQMARALTGYSTKVDIDTQWRITVPSAWRDYAGLETESPVMVVGVLDRIELWKVDLWRERMAPSMEGLANGTSRLFSPSALTAPSSAAPSSAAPSSATAPSPALPPDGA
jgi:MraZ protein